MKINLVIMSDLPEPEPDTMVEVQLPEGDTLMCGGLEVARLFKHFKIAGQGISGSEAGWRFIPYDLDPYEVSGPLGQALQREARRAAKAS